MNPYADQVARLARTISEPQRKLLCLLYDWRGDYPYPRHLTGRERAPAQALRQRGLVEGIRSLTPLGLHVYRELSWVGRGS